MLGFCPGSSTPSLVAGHAAWKEKRNEASTRPANQSPECPEEVPRGRGSFWEQTHTHTQIESQVWWGHVAEGVSESDKTSKRHQQLTMNFLSGSQNPERDPEWVSVGRPFWTHLFGILCTPLSGLGDPPHFLYSSLQNQAGPGTGVSPLSLSWHSAGQPCWRIPCPLTPQALLWEGVFRFRPADKPKPRPWCVCLKPFLYFARMLGPRPTWPQG